jgi:hypothetical protein
MYLSLLPFFSMIPNPVMRNPGSIPKMRMMGTDKLGS